MPVTELPPGGLGSAIAPEQWAAYVLEHLSAQSVVLASGATRIDTAQRQVHVPRVLSDGAADWYSELDQITETGPTGDDLVLSPKKVAALVTLSSEAVDDSNPSVLDTVGTAMTRSVALKADAGILTGAGGKGPVGVYGQAGAHVVSPAITIDSLIQASGDIAAVGGLARAAYINPVDHTTLMLEKDGNGRPLLTPDYSGGPSSTVYGLTLWQTPAIAVGTALVADPTQIVVAVRSDPTVAVSTDAIFTQDGSVCRVICRIDCGVNDARGLVSIAATTQASAEAPSKGYRK
jgi:HK97 family phage major capsid protein